MRQKKLKFRTFVCFVSTLLLVPVIYNSCKDDLHGKQFLTTEDVMIDDYITDKDEDKNMFTFLELVDKAGFRGMLHAYGNYTCFIPTNEAMDAYFVSINSSLSALTEEECVQIVKYHVIADTLGTYDFVDGRLKTPNMLAMYLTTRMRSIGDDVYHEVSRQGRILQPDIRVANGYIHKIDHVLTPPARTLGEQLSTMQRDYSLFVSIMEETGWLETLSRQKAEDEDGYTMFVQSDDVFVASGIQSRADLIKRLETTRPDIQETDLLLWTFAAYHCVKGQYYVADLMRLSSLMTSAPNQALTFKINRDSILVNEYRNANTGDFEKGIPISRKSEYTDYSMNNGVLHCLDGYIGPIRRPALMVLFKPSMQPEFVSDPRYRRSSFGASMNYEWSEMKFYLAGADTDLAYTYNSGFGADNQYIYSENLQVNLYRINAIDFMLPLLTEGTYNVWMGWRRANTEGCRVRGIFIQEGEEDQVMTNIVEPREYFSSGETDPQKLLAAGYKRYMAKQRSSVHNCRLMGTIVVQSTGRHTLRLDMIDRGRNTQVWLDMFQFIPFEEDQLWPRFDKSGKQIQYGTPCEEIYPVDVACSSDNDAY